MLRQLRKDIRSLADKERAKNSARYFKTGKGEYGEGDKFIGLTVPQVRALAKQYRELSFDEAVELLHSSIHEERLLAVILLVDQFKRGDGKTKGDLYKLYISNFKFINNWDLVDVSAPQIVGGYLAERSRRPLETMARSKNLWLRRMAVLGTFTFIRAGESEDAFRIVKILMNSGEDLLNKACGWMLREVGKNCPKGTLEGFLNEHASTIPRTMLRYAIERFPEKKRKSFLKL